jgi:predicted GNAT family acetyltransferase
MSDTPVGPPTPDTSAPRAANDAIEVTESATPRRFEARLGTELVGSAYYRRRDGRLVFTHTEVDDRFAGHGIGSTLAQAALDTARRRGEMIVPLCPFIAAYIRRHPEFQDLVDQEELDRLQGG